jgi:glycosyltransferase involved in cell wall biosynthesis
MNAIAQSTLRTAPTAPRGTVDSSPPLGSWLHLCNGLDPRRDGGMVPSILGMTGALARRSDGVTIVTPTPSRLDPAGLPPRIRLCGPETSIEEAVRSATIVHLHGLWQAQTRRGARAAIAARVPYLIAAHGMAEPWALRHKYWKKRIYLALVEARNLRRASCLHALSRPEIGHLRAIAPWAPVGFVPNGVDLASFDGLPPRSTLEDEYPELTGKFVLLFYARLHAKKGLDLLAEALRRVAPAHPDLHLLLAGNDEGALAPFRARMEEIGMARRMTYLGHVSGERAREAWAASDAFILPSYSEGFSMAILEAMACRLPCLFTTACHFSEAALAGAAVVVEPTSGDVARGLRELLDRGPDERTELGRIGRRLVERDYTWDRQAHRLASIYQWLVGGGTAPDCVEY